MGGVCREFGGKGSTGAGVDCFLLFALHCFPRCLLSPVCFLLGLDGTFPLFIDLDCTIDDTTRMNTGIVCSGHVVAIRTLVVP